VSPYISKDAETEPNGVSYRGYMLVPSFQDGGWIVRITQQAGDMGTNTTVKQFPARVSREWAISQTKRLVDALIASRDTPTRGKAASQPALLAAEVPTPLETNTALLAGQSGEHPGRGCH
jgi:hypothetical protein